ncbi:inner membrane protein [Geodermatophilus telluris]|uniref:Inner membrane protein n=1 Tax=Geodermatophilus telluris TaxID=1190417 RepID=A0A1G6LA15_9ACTN|nr:metal-dependent hydrolase [Geodermatophilus telluris]SDC39396.1 inner membrane protein [Geodermatophilus telluris]
MAARARVVLGAVAALVAVLGIDRLLALRHWSVPAEALLDEPAHLLTAGLLLAAAGVRSRRLVLWALAGAVLIDLDHVPLYLGAEVTADGGRPVSHSVTTVLVLLVAAGVWRAQRTRLAGLALGVVLHVVRDLASGPGVPLLWPLLPTSAHLPYPVYAGVLVAAVGVVALRAWRGPRRDDGYAPARLRPTSRRARR